HLGDYALRGPHTHLAATLNLDTDVLTTSRALTVGCEECVGDSFGDDILRQALLMCQLRNCCLIFCSHSVPSGRCPLGICTEIPSRPTARVVTHSTEKYEAKDPNR